MSYSDCVVRFVSADGLTATEPYRYHNLVPVLRRPLKSRPAVYEAVLLPYTTKDVREYQYDGREGDTLIYKENVYE